MKKYNFNLERELKKIKGKKTYLRAMRKLAHEGAPYQVLDKLHYMVEEKLELGSGFYSRGHSFLGGTIYCPHCGKYEGEKQYQHDYWYVVFPKEDEEFPKEHCVGEEIYFTGIKGICCFNCGYEYDVEY